MAAGEYIINWTHPSKPSFTVEPNEINGPGQPNVNSPLKLHGRFTVNYGEIIAENFAHLLENFAGPSEPAGVFTSGMLWFDTSVGSDGVLKYRNTDNDNWVIVGTGAGGSGGSTLELAPAGNFVAVAGKNYFIDTSSAAVAVTLPATPTIGDTVSFTDLAGTFDINNLTILGNGKLIMSDPTNLVCDVKYATFRIGFSNNTFGWRIVV